MLERRMYEKFREIEKLEGERKKKEKTEEIYLSVIMRSTPRSRDQCPQPYVPQKADTFDVLKFARIV